MQIWLIAVSRSAHKDTLKQCHVRRPLLVYDGCPIVLASRLMWAPFSATLDTDANEQLVQSTIVTHFCIKIMR